MLWWICTEISLGLENKGRASEFAVLRVPVWLSVQLSASGEIGFRNKCVQVHRGTFIPSLPAENKQALR